MEAKHQTTDHNQPIDDPILHFESIPWCNNLLNDPSVMGVTILDRTPLPNSEGCLVRETLNNSQCIRAGVNCYRYTPDPNATEDNGEDPENPFIEAVALLELGPGVNGFAKTLHGGMFGLLLDEIMGGVANLQASMFFSYLCLFLVSLSFFVPLIRKDNKQKLTPTREWRLDSIPHRQLQETGLYAPSCLHARPRSQACRQEAVFEGLHGE